MYPAPPVTSICMPAAPLSHFIGIGAPRSACTEHGCCTRADASASRGCLLIFSHLRAYHADKPVQSGPGSGRYDRYLPGHIRLIKCVVAADTCVSIVVRYGGGNIAHEDGL